MTQQKGWHKNGIQIYYEYLRVRIDRVAQFIWISSKNYPSKLTLDYFHLVFLFYFSQNFCFEPNFYRFRWFITAHYFNFFTFFKCFNCVFWFTQIIWKTSKYRFMQWTTFDNLNFVLKRIYPNSFFFSYYFCFNPFIITFYFIKVF